MATSSRAVLRFEDGAEEEDDDAGLNDDVDEDEEEGDVGLGDGAETEGQSDSVPTAESTSDMVPTAAPVKFLKIPCVQN